MNFATKYVLPYLKAHVAGFGAGLVMLGTDLSAGSVSVSQWEAIALTVIGIGGAVALVPNKLSVAAVAPVVAAVVHDVAPVAVVKTVAQDATQILPAVQEVAQAVLPAPVAADVQNVVAAAQAVVQAVEATAPSSAPTVAAG